MIKVSPGGRGHRKVTFAVPTPTVSGRVSVVGNFNDWTPGEHELRRRSNGTHSVAVQVPSGSTLVFRYLGEHHGWFDEPETPGDGSGNCVLAV
jgi:1,4-alpha-glucan branching enzyme